MSVSSEATLPSADYAERALVGALLLEPGVFAAVSRLVRAEDLLSPSARAAYATIAGIALAGQRADAVTVREALDRDHAAPDGGWEAWLAACARETPSDAGAPDYARIVREKAIRRVWFELGRELRDGAGARELPELLSMVTERLIAATGMTLDRPVRDAYEVAEELTRCIEASVQTIPTGIAGLDAAIGGLGRGDLVVVAGRPGMGKSALAQNIADHTAAAGKKVLFFTLEMPARMIVARMVCARTRAPLNRLMSGALSDTEAAAVVVALNDVAALPIRFCDRTVLSLADVLAECRRTKALHGIDLVVVDYLQLMQTDAAERREREIALLSAGLKRLAGELDVPVLCLSQLNRDLEKRADKRPMLADLRDSGAIEQDADVVLLLYREWVYDKGVPPTRAEIIVAKHRNGPTGDVPVAFLGEEFRFIDVAGGTHA